MRNPTYGPDGNPQTLRGQFIPHVVQRAVSGVDQLTEQGGTELVPGELLKMAKAWRREPERVLAGLG